MLVMGQVTGSMRRFQPGASRWAAELVDDDTEGVMDLRTVTIVRCDLCEAPREDVEVSTVGFGFGSRSYELDVCEDHARDVNATLALWAAKSGLAGAAPGPPARPWQSGAVPRADKAQLDVVRRWARDNGCLVHDRARIPQHVMDAFQAAHGTPPKPSPRPAGVPPRSVSGLLQDRPRAADAVSVC